MERESFLAPSPIQPKRSISTLNTNTLPPSPPSLPSLTVAMLAMLHTLVTGLGVKLPGLVAAGDGIPQSMPYGIGAVTSGAWAAQGWAQVLLFASALEVLAPQKEDKIPGDVQPDTSAFAKLDEKSEEEALKYQNTELNNGRLAMIAWLGAVVGAGLTGGEDPVATLLHKLGN